MNNKIALIVEDNPLNMSLINIMLKKLNIESIKAETGEKALLLVEQNYVDYLLLDINLGYGISGIALMEELRNQEKFRKTPIIAVTAYSYRELERYFSETGFSDYIGKPFKFDQLQEALNNA
ncbi:MAG: response regulator [Candidatus Marinimicrobia bacterium]|nr:response regulator [Candidatus Neomarinimicrobiota bacterium]